MECSRIRIKHRGLCAGDLNRLIAIQSRSDRPCNNPAEYGQVFTDTRNTWAALKTMNGREVFAGTNENSLVTSIFYIRYYVGLTAQNWILFKDERYDILDVENLDERGEFYAIYCNVRGTDTLESNDA